MYEFSTELPDRLDRLLRGAKIPGKEWLSRQAWEALLSEGRVRVNGRVERKAGLQISATSLIQIDIPELGLIPAPVAAICLWKNTEYGLFAKPVGIPTYPILPWETASFAHQISAFVSQEKLLSAAEFQALASPPILEGGIVQRLDRDTSGILVATFTSPAKILFRKVFSSHQMKKKYLAIAHGAEKISGSKTLYLGNQGKIVQAQLQENSKFQKVNLQIRTLTSKDNFHLIEIETSDGLRHVVRASMAALGLPLLGDAAYGGHTESARHHMLHALSLDSSSADLKIPSIRAPLSQAFLDTLQSLGLHYSE